MIETRGPINQNTVGQMTALGVVEVPNVTLTPNTFGGGWAPQDIVFYIVSPKYYSSFANSVFPAGGLEAPAGGLTYAMKIMGGWYYAYTTSPIFMYSGLVTGKSIKVSGYGSFFNSGYIIPTGPLEPIITLQTLTITDSGSGTESVAINFIAITSSDSGSGSESLSWKGLVSIGDVDSATTEAIASLINKFTVADSNTTTIESLIASIKASISDAGSSAEGIPTVTSRITETDSNLASDEKVFLLESYSVADAGTAAEYLISLINSFSLSDYGQGNETKVINSILSITDALSTKTESLSVSSRIHLDDADSFVDERIGGINVKVGLNDTARFTESLLVACTINIFDFGRGYNESGSVIFLVDVVDTGSAQEILAGIAAHVRIGDVSTALELLNLLIFVKIICISGKINTQASLTSKLPTNPIYAVSNINLDVDRQSEFGNVP